MKHLSIIAVASLGLILTGCGAETESSSAEAPQPTVTVTAPPAEPAPVEPKPEPSPSELEQEIAEFGDTWEYDDGMAVTVDYTGKAMASQWAAGAEETNGEMLTFEVTVHNNSGEIFDPAMVYAEVNYGETVANQVFDTENGIGNMFSGKILPGKKQTVTMGFAIPHGTKQEVLFVVAPTFMHADGLFYGTVAK